MSQSFDGKMWEDMLLAESPLVDRFTARLFYHRAASAWGCGQTLQIADGLGGWADLTKLFEQYRMLQILKGNANEE